LFFGRGWDEWDRTPLPKQQPEQAAPKQKSGRRFATTLSFCALFFAGLALSAGAGNSVRGLLQNGSPGDATSSSLETTMTAADALPAQQVQGVVHAAGLKSAVHATAAQVQAPQQLHAARASSATRETTVRVAGKTQPTRRASHAQSVARGVAGRQAKMPARAKPGRPEKTQSLDAEGTRPVATVWLYPAA